VSRDSSGSGLKGFVAFFFFFNAGFIATAVGIRTPQNVPEPSEDICTRVEASLVSGVILILLCSCMGFYR